MPSDSDSIHHHHRPSIFLLPKNPPGAHKESQPARDETGVIHSFRINRHRIREAIDHHKNKHVKTSDHVDDIANLTSHPENARADIGTTGEQVRDQSCEERSRRQDDEGANEGVKGCGGRNVNGTHDGGDDAADECRSERIFESWTDAPDRLSAGCGAVPGKRPEHPAGGGVAANGGCDDGKEDHDD